MSTYHRGDIPGQRDTREATSSLGRYDGSRPPTTGERTGIGGRSTPPHIQELLNRVSQEDEHTSPSTTPESKKAYLQQYIEERTLRNGDIRTRELADELLALRNPHRNEIPNQSIKNLNIHRNDIVEALSTFVERQHNDLQQQHKDVSSQKSGADPLVNPGQKRHDESSSANLPRNITKIHKDELIQLFGKCKAKATNNIVDRIVGSESEAESRNRFLEGMIEISRSLKETRSTEHLSNWMREGRETWIRENGIEQSLAVWEANERREMTYDRFLVSEDARQEFFDSPNFRNTVQKMREKLEHAGGDDRLREWVQYGKWYYPALAEWREKQFEDLETMRETISNPLEEMQGIGKSSSTQEISEGSNAIHNPDSIEKMPERKQEAKEDHGTIRPNIVQQMDAATLVYDRQNNHMKKYELQIRREAKRDPDTVQQNIVQQNIVQQINTILHQHNEQRENLVDVVLEMRAKNTSEKRLDPKIEYPMKEKIDEMIQAYTAQ